MGVETGDAAAASYAAQGEKVAAAASTVPESANSGMASSDVTSVPTSMGEEAGQALTDALNRFCDMVSQAASNPVSYTHLGDMVEGKFDITAKTFSEVIDTPKA